MSEKSTYLKMGKTPKQSPRPSHSRDFLSRASPGYHAVRHCPKGTLRWCLRLPCHPARGLPQTCLLRVLESHGQQGPLQISESVLHSELPGPRRGKGHRTTHLQAGSQPSSHPSTTPAPATDTKTRISSPGQCESKAPPQMPQTQSFRNPHSKSPWSHTHCSTRSGTPRCPGMASQGVVG